MADHQQQPQHLKLPTGFRFHPSDYEIINNYLTNKVVDQHFTCDAITEVDLKKTEPWDLPSLAKMGEKEWYFFYQKECKYPTGQRTNRATEAGYWKATGKDKEIYKPTKGEGVVLLVGMKKTLVFYKGRAPRGVKTNWVMHEYRLEGSVMLPSPTSASSSAANIAAIMNASTFTSKDEWVVCCVFDKTARIKKISTSTYQMAMGNAKIDQNQNNHPAIPAPMALRLSLPVPMPMQFPILPDFDMDPVGPYYPNTSEGMPSMMPPMAGVSGTSRLNGAMFGNQIAVPPQMNLYHQIGMGAARQMDMGAAGAGGFDVVALEGRLSSMVSQKVEQANATDISLMMSMASLGSATTTFEMDGISQFKY